MIFAGKMMGICNTGREYVIPGPVPARISVKIPGHGT